MKLYFTPTHALLLVWHGIFIDAGLYFLSGLCIGYGVTILMAKHDKRSKVNAIDE